MAGIGSNQNQTPEKYTRYFAELERMTSIMTSMIPPEAPIEDLAIATGYILEPRKPIVASMSLGLIATNHSHPIQMRFQLTGTELEVKEAPVMNPKDYEVLNLEYTIPGVEHIPIFVGPTTTTVFIEGYSNTFPSPHILSALKMVVADHQFQQESLTQRSSVLQMLSILTGSNSTPQ
ncbi:MAG TPA: hypothetical protein PLV59_00885 [Candidatus Dojkabacteria bacterium]|nr:hypothetical protein [Candidatus Dojkabacteria bacterium]